MWFLRAQGQSWGCVFDENLQERQKLRVRDTSGLRTLRRPGLAGVCRAYPAASDLAGIYEDVGAVLITLSTSIVPSFRFTTSVSRGSAMGAIRSSPGYYPFERKIFPPVSSTKGNHR